MRVIPIICCIYVAQFHIFERLIKIPKCSYQSVSQILLLSWKREVLMVSCIWAWQMQSKNTSEVQKSRFQMRFCQTLPTSWHIWNIYATRGRYRWEGSPQTTFCKSSFIGYDEINQNFRFEFKSSAFPTFCMNEECECVFANSFQMCDDSSANRGHVTNTEIWKQEPWSRK